MKHSARYRLFFLSLVLCAGINAARADPPTIFAPKPATENLAFISIFQSSGGWGTTPVIKLTAYANGALVYGRLPDAAAGGRPDATLSAEDYQALKAWAEQLDNSACSLLSDQGSLTVVIRESNQTTKIFKYGCRLWELAPHLKNTLSFKDDTANGSEQ